MLQPIPEEASTMDPDQPLAPDIAAEDPIIGASTRSDQPLTEPLTSGYTIGCAKCRKPQEELDAPLKVCSVCKLANPYMCYCSKECQRADWPLHKKICGVWVDRATSHPVQQMTARLTHSQYQFPQGPPGRAYDVFVQHEDEQLTYKLVIDAYRCLDEAKRDYNPQYFDLLTFFCWLDGYSFEGLQRFLDRTLDGEIKSAIMPLWWSEEHRDKCEKLAKEWYHWSDVKTNVAREVNELLRYGGPAVRLPLRIVAAKIDGQLSMEALGRVKALNAIDMLALMGQGRWA